MNKMKDVQMKTFKQMILRTFLVVEVVIFSCTYIFGAQGLRSMWYIKNECITLEYEIEQLQGSIKQIELDIDIWKSDPFYKEKIAREQLGMAREDEIIYVTV